MALNKGLLGGNFVKVYTPTITDPSAGDIETTRLVTVASSAFASFGGVNITHHSTDWQVSDAADFSTIRWQNLGSTSAKVTDVTADLDGGTRYVRVRYKASDGTYSDWSDGVQFVSPWASSTGDTTITTATNMEINASTGITFRAGTYRITLWGGAGAKGANGAAGGAGAAVRKDVLFPAPWGPAPFTIGGGGNNGCHNNPGNPGACSQAQGGAPGGGAGGFYTNPNGTWNGGGGGSYSYFTATASPHPSSPTYHMTAGGGGGGSAGGSPSQPGALAGGQSPTDSPTNSPAGWGGGGCPGANGPGPTGASGSAGAASADSGGAKAGGGGGGSHQSGHEQAACQNGNGGNNYGGYDAQFPGTWAQVGNPYTSTAYSRVFGEGNGSAGGGRIEKIDPQNVPVVSITTDISATHSAQAGDNQNFVIVANDTANTDTVMLYQWQRSTNSGGSWSDITGATSGTLTRYNPFYYDDHNDQIRCKVTGTNTAGTDTEYSTVCTLTVTRNWDCTGGSTTGTQFNVSGDGLKPSASTTDETWGTWTPGWTDICHVGGGMNMRAGGRCGFCETSGVYQGWNMKLQLQILDSSGTVRRYDEKTKNSGTCGNGSHADWDNFSIASQSWDYDSWGTPTFRMRIFAAGTNCGGSAGENIFAEQWNNTGKLDWTYTSRNYHYETRP